MTDFQTKPALKLPKKPFYASEFNAALGLILVIFTVLLTTLKVVGLSALTPLQIVTPLIVGVLASMAIPLLKTFVFPVVIVLVVLGLLSVTGVVACVALFVLALVVVLARLARLHKLPGLFARRRVSLATH